jgi:demethylmenaquinone methyltransferase / 2-methoxy-6-polyprenyl-1,4-benzoquinol methylase
MVLNARYGTTLSSYLRSPMAKYLHDKIVPFKDSNLGKKEQVADMFNRIAPRYDFLNRFLSAGVDVYWRKKAIKELTGLQPQIILDTATGTADIPIMIAKYLHPKKIVGIDISEGMLELGRKKIAALNLTKSIELQAGDCEAINFPDNEFDAITVAFGVRNFENLENGLREMIRVLKPGGKLVILEFSKPRQSGFKEFYDFYMRLIAPAIGKMVSKNKEAYRYLNESVNIFPEGNDFIAILKNTGYTHTYLKRLSMGICTIYCGMK